MKLVNVYKCFFLLHGVYFGKSIIDASASASHESDRNWDEAPQLPQNLNKSCVHSLEDCVFRLDHLLSYHEVYLDCLNWHCTCTTRNPSPERPNWDLEWNGLGCLISEFGPCGENSGLEMACQEDLLCIQSRCRNPRNLQKSKLDELCFDDVDCHKTLICELESVYPGKKKCKYPTRTFSVNKPQMRRFHESTSTPTLRYKSNHDGTQKELPHRFNEMNTTYSGRTVVINDDSSPNQNRGYYKDKTGINQIKVLSVHKRDKQRTNVASMFLLEIKLAIIICVMLLL